MKEAEDRGFSLDGIEVEDGGRKVDGGAVLRMAFQALPLSKNVAYHLHKSTDGTKTAMSAIQAGFRGCMELEENTHNRKLKTITAYFGSQVNHTT